MKYKNEEWITMRNHFLIGFFIFLIFSILMIFFFINKFQIRSSSLIKKIENKETFLLYVIEKDCRACKIGERALNKKNVAYEKLNKSNNRDYDDILIALEQENIQMPSLYYIVEGSVYSSLSDPTEEEIEEYIDLILGGNV